MRFHDEAPKPDVHQRVYDGVVNEALLALLPTRPGRVLDVGCGTGANARRLRELGHEVWGLTMNADEARLAKAWCRDVLVANLDDDLPSHLPSQFDALLLSHVLEHLVDPSRTLSALAALLVPKGVAAIAVPNMAAYELRLRFLRGDWTREDLGAMDRTHRQFWSFETAPEVLKGTPLRLVERRGDAAPMSSLARVAPGVVGWLRSRGASRWPNLVCWQTLLLAERA